MTSVKITPAIILAWIVVTATCLHLASQLAFILRPNDFDVYLAASSAFSLGHSPYLKPVRLAVSSESTADCYYLYPPLLASLLRPLLMLDRETARVIWSSLNTVAVTITAVAGSVAGLWSTRNAPLAMLILFLLPFSIDAFSTGQVDTILLASFSLVLAGIVTRRERLAAFALAIAIHLKAAPIVLLIVLLRRDSRLLLLHTTIYSVGIATCLSLVHGIEIWNGFLSAGEAVSSGRWSWGTTANRSPGKLLLFLFPAELTIQTANGIVVLLATTSLILLTTINMTRNRQLPLPRMVGIGIVVTTFSSPILWYHHLMWLALPITLAWHARPDAGSRTLIATCAAVLISSIVLDISATDSTNYTIGVDAYWSGILLFVAGILCYLLVQHRGINDPIEGSSTLQLRPPL